MKLKKRGVGIKKNSVKYKMKSQTKHKWIFINCCTVVFSCNVNISIKI